MLPGSSVVRAKSDADVLTDLQQLGTSVNITGYSSLPSQITTWDDTPSALDKNAVLAYFQQNNHMETI